MGHIPVAKRSPIPREWQFPKRGLAIVLLLVGVFAVGGVILAITWPTDPGPSAVTLVRAGKVSGLEAGQPVRPEGEPFWLVKEPNGTVIALAIRDPRTGCTIPWRPDFTFEGRKGWFREPCHGSTYEADGNKVFGPSSRDMDYYEVSIRGDEIYVNTAEIICSNGLVPCITDLRLPDN